MGKSVLKSNVIVNKHTNMKNRFIFIKNDKNDKKMKNFLKNYKKISMNYR
jgi:hypothetical protein